VRERQADAISLGGCTPRRSSSWASTSLASVDLAAKVCSSPKRGTGRSAIPADAGSYRCDRLVDDVESLRKRLGLDRMDVLAHSAGANLAARYVERHPERVGRLALIAPSVMAVGIEIPGDVRRESALLRRDEPWFSEAWAALEAIVPATRPRTPSR
jgi:pimeloyl-ACP methyl ester carboxylesterase